MPKSTFKTEMKLRSIRISRELLITFKCSHYKQHHARAIKKMAPNKSKRL